MKPENFDSFIERARRGRADAKPSEDPFFTTRVLAARGVEESLDTLALWERLARWGLVTAGTAWVITALTLPTVSPSPPSALAEFAGLVAGGEADW